MQDALGEHYLKIATQDLRELKELADRALAQVGDEDFFRAIDPESNSLALIVKHLAGNMRSRWTDFLTTDGEKPDRRRDSEFEDAGDDRGKMMERWEAGWATLFGALESLKPEDLLRTVLIRREPHTVVEAVNRQTAHYGQHVGQIIFLAKHLQSSAWQTLSIPRGRSETFNAGMEEKHGNK